jgi:broad specificity phosphatase PhoE
MSEPRQRIVLVRHGETEWTISRRHTGRTDVPLTDAGRQEAKLIGARLADVHFTAVLTSPLSRAAETCALAGLDSDTPVVETDDLLEWDYGDYEGRRTADIRAERPGWLLFTDGVPNGESPDDVARRVDRVIARVRDIDGNVALFAHGHLLRVLGSRWIEQPPEHGAQLMLSTAAISLLGWEREVPVLVHWNSTAHLET